jgi:hypothetical protein
MLVTPILWGHYLLMLLIPLCAPRVVPTHGLARIAFFLSVGALWVPLSWFMIIPMGSKTVFFEDGYLVTPTRPWQSLVGMSVQTYALLILFVLGWRSFRDSPAPPAEAGPPVQK